MKKIVMTVILLTAVCAFVGSGFANVAYTPSKLLSDSETDKTLQDKEVTVSGEVNSTQLSGTKTKFYVSLRDKGATGYAVYCEIPLAAGSTAPTVEIKSQVTVKGVVKGKFFKAVKLNKCSLVK